MPFVMQYRRYKLGIRVVMLTSDNKNTDSAIGTQVGVDGVI